MKPSITSEAQMQARADSLKSRGEAFAIATVVRTVDSTSAKPGAKALILADGTFAEGWVGGGCARGAVSRAAKEAILDGTPKFVSLMPEELLDAEGVSAGEERGGTRFARNGCPSKGSMDVFVEPVLPVPQLIICGDGPVATAVAALSSRLDMRRTLCAAGIGSAEAMGVDETRDGFAFDTNATSQRFVVVATQGKGDEAALRAAIASGADYVAFVGSRRKFATLRDRLVGDGLDQEALDRVAAPAGLDIAAITPDEIALSILAQIVSHRRLKQRKVGSQID